MTALEAAAAVLGDRARRHVPLGPLTTYRVGGPAALFLEAHRAAELALAARAVRESGLPVLVVGRGSNLLVADRGFPGLAISLGHDFATLTVTGEQVRAGAAVSLPVVARRTAASGLRGLEWAVGVPGSVGGAVRMNAGGHGSEISRVLSDAEVVDLAAPGAEVRRLAAGQLGLGYRRSALSATEVVVAAGFALASGDPEEAEREISEVVRWRRENQPGGANAGSVFANPPGDSAGRLIEAAGLKGIRRGSAFVSPKHANFFQCDDGGSADDVVALMAHVAEVVQQRTGVRLLPEVRLVGFGAPTLEVN